MKQHLHGRIIPLLKISIALFAVIAFGWCGLALLLLNPFATSCMGANESTINAQTLAGIVGTSPDAQEVLWEHKVIQLAAQLSPFADNMTGPLGSGKPFIQRNDTTKVIGQQIVIPTVERSGGNGVFAGGQRVGQEDRLLPGDFKLTIGLWWYGLGISNDGKAQTIIGDGWDDLAQEEAAERLDKKLSDDKMMVLRGAANSATGGDNLVYSNGKSLDTLLSSDTFNTDLVIYGTGQLRDIGARPMNMRPHDGKAPVKLPPVPGFLVFGTDVGMRPIKQDALYAQAVQLAQERGPENNFFTGQYIEIDGSYLYPWQNIRHGGYGSIGSALQPEAKLGVAIVAKATSNTFPGGQTPTAGQVLGGGSAAAAALTNVDYFEFWRLFTWTLTNGLTVSIGTGTRYFAIINATDGKVSFFSYTANNASTGIGGTANGLTGVTRLGSTIAGDYNTTVGGVTWNTGAWTTAASGGYAGVSEGLIAVGSLMLECNSKGVPLCEAFGLGEMAAVCGYGRVPLPKGGFKTMANRTEWVEPHNRAFSRGIEISHGSAAFQRPNSAYPNFTNLVFARRHPQMPVVTS
jgi:hypothetical protein